MSATGNRIVTKGFPGPGQYQQKSQLDHISYSMRKKTLDPCTTSLAYIYFFRYSHQCQKSARPWAIYYPARDLVIWTLSNLQIQELSDQNYQPCFFLPIRKACETKSSRTWKLFSRKAIHAKDWELLLLQVQK